MIKKYKKRDDQMIKNRWKCNFLYVNFKIAKNINDLEKRAEDAIKQIENKGYDM